jgi:uncharacterized protein (TIGR02271 family)
MQNTTTNPDTLFGYDVLDGGGNSIGSVDSVWVDDATSQLEFIAVKTGWLFGKNHVIPTQDASIDSNAQTISVPYGKDQVENAPSFDADAELSPEDEDSIYSAYGMQRSTAPSPTGMGTDSGTAGQNLQTNANQTTGSYGDQTTGDFNAEQATGDQINVPVVEEELAVGKRQVQTGQVRLRKVVNTEHQEVPVTLQREEVQVERVPADESSFGTDATEGAFQEREINVPVMAEEPVVEKQAQVTGQVRLNKTAETETRTVEGDVRSTDVEIEGDGDTAQNLS